MKKAEQENKTTVTEFLLLGFGDLGDQQLLLFSFFLLIYIATVVGNILIVVLVVVDHHLHTPMYFFLGNLSCLETCYSSDILPLMLSHLFHGGRGTISVTGCMTQFYLFGFLAVSECYLLAAMSYDRYVAICNPLLYTVLINGKVCLQLVAGSWVSGSLTINITIYLMYQLTFCGPSEINHFFCDFNPILKLSCSDTRTIKLLTFFLAAVCSLPPFLLTLTSYGFIISSIIMIPSTSGRQKAFSTCSSHLIVVSIFYGTVMIVYMLPRSETLEDLNKVFSVFYTVLTPLLNPMIYSLRNREVKVAFRRTLAKFYAFERV
ncbi:olfactory receptor 5A2-like [Paroedura picta]|uniref:olfactory receptor 5A2-like n=1 Tax=Paroedura picta TaxID=143630 RepID=UPI004055E3FC